MLQLPPPGAVGKLVGWPPISRTGVSAPVTAGGMGLTWTAALSCGPASPVSVRLPACLVLTLLCLSLSSSSVPFSFLSMLTDAEQCRIIFLVADFTY